MCEARWAIAYNAKSASPRARRWYRVTRVVHADARWFELYWHPDRNLRGYDRASVRRAAVLLLGADILPGTFRDKPGNLNELEFSK